MKGLGSHYDLLGTELDDVLEGVEQCPVDPSPSAQDETATLVAPVIADIRVGVDPDKARRIVARTIAIDEGDEWLHQRYRGRLRRGRIPRAVVDADEIKHARSALDLGSKTLAEYHAACAAEPAVRLPRIQREHLRSAALARLVEARRWVDEVLRYYGYEAPEPADDG